MECQECQKRPATLHFTQVLNGNKIESHVCEKCAKEKGYITYPEEGYSLHNLLAGLFSFESPSIGNHDSNSFQQVKELRCPKCHMTFSRFKRTGKFGCATCYEAFSSRLDPIFRRVHSGNIKHNGKIPKREGGNLRTKKQLAAYKKELQQLIENEAFEKAAIVRDKIKELQNDQSEGEDHDTK